MRIVTILLSFILFGIFGNTHIVDASSLVKETVSLPNDSVVYVEDRFAELIDQDFIAVNEIYDIIDSSGDGQRVYIFEWADVVDHASLSHIDSPHDSGFYNTRDDLVQHSTMVSSVFGGSDTRYPGLAPFATSSIHPITSFGEVSMLAGSVSINAWGIGGCDSNLYSDFSRSTDRIALNGNLSVFSASNTGISCDTDKDGFYSNKNSAPGRNGLAVGAYNHETRSIHPTSSTGPTISGRLYPDLIAHGTNIITRCNASSGGYCIVTGTSIAAPQVGAAIVVMNQHYTHSKESTVPLENHTSKSLLFATTEDVGSLGIDYKNGFGLMDLDGALHALKHQQFFTGSLATVDDTKTHSLTIPEGTQSTRIVLVWNDLPNESVVNPYTPSGSYDYIDPHGDVFDVNGDNYVELGNVRGSRFVVDKLINDLDLVLVSPSGEVYFPQSLDPLNPSNLPTSLGSDHINVVESVWLSNPESGDWEIIVSSSLQTSEAPFSVAYDFDLHDNTNDVVHTMGIVEQFNAPLVVSLKLVTATKPFPASATGIFLISIAIVVFTRKLVIPISTKP